MEIHEKYKIIKPLGNQKIRKFGEVFLVKQKNGENEAVMKVANRSNVSPLVYEQLKSEATFSFDHPALPNILETQETENEFFLITEFKPGISLTEFWLKLKKKERILFLISFLEKFDKVYEELRIRNIVHCDIKPSNILIDGSLESFDIYLLDFGLAVKKDDIPDRKLVFPLGFAAPELILNELELIDERTDIFALGVTIWRIYAKKLPLTHPNPSIFTNLQLTHPLPEHDEIPRKIYSILNKMSWKHQFNRPPNQLSTEERTEKLTEGMKGRYDHFHEVIEDLEKVKRTNKGWWPFTT